jgi:hypothetical protein
MKEKICLLSREKSCALRCEGGHCRAWRGEPDYRNIDCRHAIDAHPAVDEGVQE